MSKKLKVGLENVLSHSCSLTHLRRRDNLNNLTSISSPKLSLGQGMTLKKSLLSGHFSISIQGFKSALVST